MGNKIEYSSLVEVYDEITKFKILKNVIKDNIEIDERGNATAYYNLADELIKVIKYTDEKFYNEIKQQKAEQ